MTSKKGFWHGLIFILLALVLAGSILVAACGDDKDETPTATAVPPTATATAVPPTATATAVPPTATATAVPPTATATAVPPTATATAVPPTATATAVPPTATAEPTATIPAAPAMPSGWQALPEEQRIANKVSFYFPGEWITMTSQPLPTIILALDPTFFPNSELRVFDVEAGTTNAEFREWIKSTYPSSAGGEYDAFTVLEEGDITLDNGVETVYLIYKGTRMGYGAQAIGVCLVNGTQGFILTGGDYPVTFEDSQELLTQIVKTLHILP